MKHAEKVYLQRTNALFVDFLWTAGNSSTFPGLFSSINKAEILDNEIVPVYPIDWENILRNYNISTIKNPDKEIDEKKTSLWKI